MKMLAYQINIFFPGPLACLLAFYHQQPSILQDAGYVFAPFLANKPAET